MNVWFEAAQAMFEIFLEEKLEFFGSSVTLCGESSAPQLSMRTLPTEFIDNVHEEMERVYIELPSGFEASDCGDSTDFLYGELTPLGVRQLASIIRPYASRGHFVDFGCGTGKVVFELALLFPEMHCIGVELSAERATIGKIAINQIPQASNLSIICGSFFDYPSVSERATLAFCCGLGFDEAMTRKLLDRLSEFSDLNVCVLLLRQDPRGFVSHPLFQRAISTNFSALLCTSWMNEAPATVLIF